jgi:acyl-CoA dehydrogenase
MTEPAVASSNATNIQTTIVRDGDDYVVTGREWWITGVADNQWEVFIVMGQTDPSAEPHRRQSMILVPRDAARVTVERHIPIFGSQDQHGHSQILFDGVRVPASNLLGQEGDGFKISQARLGPGRIHHAMRAIGMAERALALMVDRVKSRTAFGSLLADQGVVQDAIARSRIEIDQIRLYVYKTAWLIDHCGSRGAATEIAGIKVAALAVATAVIDRAIECSAAREWVTTSRCHTSTRGPAYCGSSTAPTPCTGAPSLAVSCSASLTTGAEASLTSARPTP